MQVNMTSFIRYRYKSEKDFKLFECHGIGCAVFALKKFLAGNPSKSKPHHPKNKFDFVITDTENNKGLSLNI